MVKILLAEDDKNLGFILKKELEGDQHAVDLVTNGVDAVLNFMKNPYEFVLLDLRMPRLGGNDALRIIKQFNPHIPVITFSGNAGSVEMVESKECGAIKCLRKPFEVEGLKKEIWKHAGRKIGLQNTGTQPSVIELLGPKR
jgi:DNA-binding response OmpR family regulator